MKFPVSSRGIIDLVSPKVQTYGSVMVDPTHPVLFALIYHTMPAVLMNSFYPTNFFCKSLKRNRK